MTGRSHRPDSMPSEAYAHFSGRLSAFIASLIQTTFAITHPVQHAISDRISPKVAWHVAICATVSQICASRIEVPL